MVLGREDVDVIPHVRIQVIYPNDDSWSGVNFSCSGRQDIHVIVQSKLD